VHATVFHTLGELGARTQISANAPMGTNLMVGVKAVIRRQSKTVIMARPTTGMNGTVAQPLPVAIRLIVTTSMLIIVLIKRHHEAITHTVILFIVGLFSAVTKAKDVLILMGKR
jgi:hypothetical protein